MFYKKQIEFPKNVLPHAYELSMRGYELLISKLWKVFDINNKHYHFKVEEN